MRNIEDVTLKDGRNLKKVLELHRKWLEDDKSGIMADLSCEDLSYVDLSNVDLRYADCIDTDFTGSNMKDANFKCATLRLSCFKGAKMKCINLSCTDLRGTNLENADLTEGYLESANLDSADLFGACLKHAIFRGSYLKDADLRNIIATYCDFSYTDLYNVNLTCGDIRYASFTKAELIGTILTNVKYNSSTSSFALQCPEEGSFIGYDKANDKIVKLLITEDAKRSSATTRKCRCSKAKVLSITSLDGKKNFKKVASDHDSDFTYEVGKIVEVKNYDENRWIEWGNGIHFFITRDEAVMY